MTTDSNSYRNAPLRPQGGKTAKGRQNKVLTSLGKTLHDLLMLVFRLAKWVTGPGRGILMGLLGFYFLLVGAENYWQSFSPSTPSFIPKPFISDGANLGLLPGNFFRLGFWFSFLFAAAFNSLQSAWVRENRSIKRLVDQHRKVAGIQDPGRTERAIWLAKWTRSRIRNYGRKAVRVAGFAVAISYAIDIWNAIYAFPIVGVDPQVIVIHFFWVLLSVIGTELAWSFI